MTNNEKRSHISKLKEELAPLYHDKFIASLRHNYLSNPARKPLSEEQQQELDDASDTLKQLNEKIAPIFKKMRSLQTKYLVEYEGVALEAGVKKTVFNRKEFYLSTDVEIDTYETRPDFSNPDIEAIIEEITDYISDQEYLEFSLQHVQRLQ